MALLGLVCLAFGIWGTVDSAPVDSVPVQVSIAPVGLVVAGIIFLGFALFELLGRLRHGPQKSGRHAVVEAPSHAAIRVSPDERPFIAGRRTGRLVCTA